MTRKATIIILVSVVAALVAWDVFVYLEPSPRDTVSEVTLGFVQDHPVVGFTIGVVCGHLLWPQRVSK